jgi:hypothetical protein
MVPDTTHSDEPSEESTEEAKAGHPVVFQGVLGGVLIGVVFALNALAKTVSGTNLFYSFFLISIPAFLVIVGCASSAARRVGTIRAGMQASLLIACVSSVIGAVADLLLTNANIATYTAHLRHWASWPFGSPSMVDSQFTPFVHYTTYSPTEVLTNEVWITIIGFVVMLAYSAFAGLIGSASGVKMPRYALRSDGSQLGRMPSSAAEVAQRPRDITDVTVLRQTKFPLPGVLDRSNEREGF